MLNFLGGGSARFYKYTSLGMLGNYLGRSHIDGLIDLVRVRRPSILEAVASNNMRAEVIV